MSDTRFEEYEKKTRVIILIIGFIALLSFIFGLVILSIEEPPYNPETSNPTYTTDESSVPDDYSHEQVPIIQGENEFSNENQKAIWRGILGTEWRSNIKIFQGIMCRKVPSYHFLGTFEWVRFG